MKRVAIETLARDVERLKKNESEPEPARLCTCATHGAEFINQRWYQCETCGLVDDLGCCEACAETCHKGHVCVYQGVGGKCYCDCGAGDGPRPCHCMGDLGGRRLIRAQLDGGEGIIGMMKRKMGGNLHDRGQVIVTSSDLYSDNYLQKYVLDLGDKTSCYESRNLSGAWFCLDFRERRVFVSHYWVRTYGNGPGHLRTWVREGSLNGDHWEQIDEVKNAASMDDDFASLRRAVTGAHGPFRYVRFRMTGKNHAGQWFLNCSGIELFGTLCEQ